MNKNKLLQYAVIGIAALIALLTIRYLLIQKDRITEDTETEHDEANILYGIEIDSMLLYEDVVKSGESLSTILNRYKVSPRKIDEMARKSRDVFDVRRIRAGNQYTVLASMDSLESVQYFIYEDSPTRYVVYYLGDSVHVYSETREIERRIKYTSGVIESSLWNAMVAQGDNPQLALELSEIYAWTIDFFAIQRGDKFKAIYETLYVEDKPIGIGRVLASYFQNAGNDFYGFYFVQDGSGEYFDEKANNLRKAFLKAPLKFSRISSHFSNSRLHPVHRVYRPHHGVDYAAPAGTPVMAIGDGVVTIARYRGANGNMVEIKHNNVNKTQYLHLSRFGSGIKEGVRVKQGQVIGYVGSTGTSTGPHLDFRFYVHGKPVNPLTVKSPPADPVKDANREEFLNLADSLMNKLKAIGSVEEVLTGLP